MSWVSATSPEATARLNSWCWLALQRHHNFFKESTVSSFKPQQACESTNSTTLTEIQTLVHVIKTHQVTPKSHPPEQKVEVAWSIFQSIWAYAGGGGYGIWERKKGGSDAIHLTVHLYICRRRMIWHSRERKKRQQWCDHPPAFVHMQEDGMALEKET